MFSWVWRWINDRWPASYLVHLALEEEIPGGSSFAYTLGSALLATFLLQAVTGILQLFFYVPTVDHAYDSLNFLWFQVPFGWLIHGLHYWGANSMIILIVLHISRVFIWGAYKSPRELTWLFGVSLLLVVMGLSFTGGPLPWNQNGYWAAEVGTSIPGSIPVVGDMIKRAMRGGDELGQLTLSRFFVLHAAILPSVLFVLIGVHIISFRKFGAVGPWDAVKRKLSGPFWPDQVFKDLVIATSVILVLIGLTVFTPPPVSGPADPLDSSYFPKPEWNFLFLYQALKYFPGILEPVGSAGIPTILVFILLLLPFYDHRSERNPFRRPFAMAGGLTFAGMIIVLTIMGFYSAPGVSPPVASKPFGTTQVTLPVNTNRGAQLFQSLGCVGCHRVNGTGGTIGPNLSQEGIRGRSRDWLTTQIRNPKAHNPDTVMPSFASLNDRQLNDLLDFLLSSGEGNVGQKLLPAVMKKQRGMESSRSPVPAGAKPSLTGEATGKEPGRAAYIIGSADRGAVLFAEECSSCHGPRGTDNVSNPGSEEGTVPSLNPIDKELSNNDPQIFAENIDRFIQYGSTPPGANPQLKMIAFGDTNALTQQQIANIEAYILRLNGVERSKLINPGMKPRNFFLLVVGLYVVLILIQGGIRVKRGIP